MLEEKYLKAQSGNMSVWCGLHPGEEVQLSQLQLVKMSPKDLLKYARHSSGQEFAVMVLGRREMAWRDSALRGQAINCVVKMTAKFPAPTFNTSAATQFR